MNDFSAHRRLLLLTEGHLGVFTAKTAAVLLRYRRADVVAVVDSQAAGRQLAEFIPSAPDVPIVPDIAAASGFSPDALVVGVAPVGGVLPENMRRHVCAALAAGLDVVSGLHRFLSEDAEIASLLARGTARVIELRRRPASTTIAAARAKATHCRRVLTVGSDASVGKMLTAVELTEAARRRGLDARMLATGQTGILVAGGGVPVDACIADFAPGAVEDLVLAAAEADVVFVEGQGSLGHPGYSAVALALLHGACPDALLLVHAADRTHYKAPPFSALPPIAEQIAAYEQVAALVHPARVVAIALNTVTCSAEIARDTARRLEDQFGLPVADPVRDGCERLLDAVLAAPRHGD